MPTRISTWPMALSTCAKADRSRRPGAGSPRASAGRNGGRRIGRRRRASCPSVADRPHSRIRDRPADRGAACRRPPSESPALTWSMASISSSRRDIGIPAAAMKQDGEGGREDHRREDQGQAPGQAELERGVHSPALAGEIADAAQRMDLHAGLRGLELLAQARDMGLQRVRPDLVVEAVESFFQQAARHHAAGAAQQQLEQGELAGGERQTDGPRRRPRDAPCRSGACRAPRSGRARPPGRRSSAFTRATSSAISKGLAR